MDLNGQKKESLKEKNMLMLANYQDELRKHPRLRFLFFELTDQCNLNCQHCGSGCSGGNHTYLDYDAVIGTVSEVKDQYGTDGIMVCITGGEPLLHPAVYDVIKSAHDMGFPVGITTNGTLIDNITAKQLAAAGLDTVAVSLDGVGKVHDSFRLSKGAFDRAVSGLRYLKKAGLEPQVITVVHKNNYYHLDDIYRFLKKKDIYSWRLVNVDPIGRALDNQSLLLSFEQMKGLFEYIRTKRFDNENEMEVTYGCSHFATFEYENEIRDYYFQCGAGLFVASVMANGDIGTCLDIERRPDLVQGNIYKDDFIQVWENKFDVFRQNRAKLSISCKDCRYSTVCMGDSAHTWDYDNNEPRYCAARSWEV